MRVFLFVVMCVFLSGCRQNNNTYILSEKEMLSDEIIRKVAIKIKKEKNLHPCGTGGQMMDQIKMLYLGFNYYYDITIDEGRELLVYAVNEFVSEVNADERIRPYLNNYPFEPKNVQIGIFLFTQDGSLPALGKLIVITAQEGKLQYEIDDPETKLFKTVHSETFEEAVLKIKQSKNGMHEETYAEALELVKEIGQLDMVFRASPPCARI